MRPFIFSNLCIALIVAWCFNHSAICLLSSAGRSFAASFVGCTIIWLMLLPISNLLNPPTSSSAEFRKSLRSLLKNSSLKSLSKSFYSTLFFCKFLALSISSVMFSILSTFAFFLNSLSICSLAIINLLDISLCSYDSLKMPSSFFSAVSIVGTSTLDMPALGGS